MADPVVWYTINAQLDGVDTGSDNLQDRLKFCVYQRRMTLEAMKTKAMLLAMMGNTEAAGKAATEYMDVAVPTTLETQLEHQAALDARMDEIKNMAPIKAIVAGKPVPLARQAPSFAHAVNKERTENVRQTIASKQK